MNYFSDDFLKGFNGAVNSVCEEKGSKLEKYVRKETAKNIVHSVDGRHISLKTEHWCDCLDVRDEIKKLNQKSSAYVLNAAYALGRKKDQRIIEAALGTAYTGRNGQDEVAFPLGQKIDADYREDGGTGNTGLTLDKLRVAREMLDDADVDDMEEKIIVLTAKQMSNLLRSTEVTSSDYTKVRDVLNGHVDSFLGFEFIRVSSLIMPKNSCFVWAKSGLLMATSGEVITDIYPIKDKRNTAQLYASLGIGASRMDENKVIEILC